VKCEIVETAAMKTKQLGRPGRTWEDNIRKDLRDISGKVWTGWIWRRIGASGRLL